MDIGDRNQYTYYQKSGSKVKRIFDIMMSLLCLVFAGVPMILIAILVKLTSKGPVIFRQKRVGFNAKPFDIYKFRTMQNGTDDWRYHLTLEQQKEYQMRFKLRNDPRVTRLGKFLRRTSLDELPQFINVLKGDMSLVGPRPITVDELALFGKYADHLISIKPGITCISQINGRSSITLNERIQYDMEYIKQSCVILDFMIFCKTVILVILRRGAM